jgi:hypothetical protein
MLPFEHVLREINEAYSCAISAYKNTISPLPAAQSKA